MGWGFDQLRSKAISEIWRGSLRPWRGQMSTHGIDELEDCPRYFLIIETEKANVSVLQ